MNYSLNTKHGYVIHHVKISEWIKVVFQLDSENGSGKEKGIILQKSDRLKVPEIKSGERAMLKRNCRGSDCLWN